MTGLVYYVLDATHRDQRVKIGTTVDLRSRLVTLRAQTTTRQEPLVLALELGGDGVERRRHEQFADRRLTGEWHDYHYGDDLWGHVKALPNPLGWLADTPEAWPYARGWGPVPDLPAPVRNLLARHEPYHRSLADEVYYCSWCAEPWPCDVGRALPSADERPLLH